MSEQLSQPLPFVLVPALLCDEALYEEMVAALAGRVAPDVMVAAQPTVAASVAEILERAPARFVLGGSSYGGTVALEVALAAPERVAALWLTSCDPGAPDAAQTLGLAGMVEDSTEAAVAHLAGLVVHPGASEAAATFRAMAGRVGGAAGGAQARALAARGSAWERLPSLTMPALLVWGAEDALIPVAMGRRLAAALPDARLRVLDACGHLPTIEQPGEVAAIVGGWLDEVVLAVG